MSSKQAQRRQAARDRQQATGRSQGFFATVSEPGKPDRVIAEKYCSPPAEGSGLGLPYLKFRASSDPLLSWSGAPSVAQLEAMLDEQAADLGHQADDRLGGWESRTTIVPSGAIDLGTTPLA